ncbi:MAG TPA: hypothetical protein VLG71_03240 [Candidatus Limnocylindria bacterium]|nr:hypothetical protein [Candidatus Limnocylindria bacterium]
MKLKYVYVVVVMVFVIAVETVLYGAATVQESRVQQSARDFVAGVVAGAAEGVTGRPLDFVKNRLQQGGTWRKVLVAAAREPQRAYSGFALNAAGNGAATAALAVAKQWMVSAVVPAGQQPTFKEKMACAGAAGAASAVLVGPMGAMTVYKQNRGGTYGDAIRNASKTAGFKAVAAREGLWGAGLFAAYPAAKKWLLDHNQHEVVATLGASLTAGPAVALASHPFDTVQAIVVGARHPKVNLDQPLPYAHVRNECDAFRYLAQNGGLCRGVWARCGRVACALPVMMGAFEKTSVALKKLSTGQ